MLALLAVVHAGGVFYASAWNALRYGPHHADVPISIGVTLAFALSLLLRHRAGRRARLFRRVGHDAVVLPADWPHVRIT